VRLTNYYNTLDDVLSISAVKRIGVAPRVGRNGMTQPFHHKAANIYCGQRFKSGGFDDGLNAGHAFYFDDPVFLQDVFHTVSGRLDREEIPTRRPTDRGNLALVDPG